MTRMRMNHYFQKCSPDCTIQICKVKIIVLFTHFYINAFLYTVFSHVGGGVFSCLIYLYGSDFSTSSFAGLSFSFQLCQLYLYIYYNLRDIALIGQLYIIVIIYFLLRLLLLFQFMVFINITRR